MSDRVSRWRLFGLISVLGLGGMHCSEPLPPPPVALRILPMIEPWIAEPVPEIPPKPSVEQRFKAAIIYLDGEPQAVLRLPELPTQLNETIMDFGDDHEYVRYRFDEYFDALGIDVAKIRAMYIHGGRSRVSLIDGDEMRKWRETFTFSFTRERDGGKARVHYPPLGEFKTNTTVDMMNAISVFVEKAPPEFVQKERLFRTDTGEQYLTIPYASDERTVSGTRVYVDQRVVGAVKRRTLPDEWLVEGSDVINPRFSFKKFLESTPVEPESAKIVEVLQGDAVIARVEGRVFLEEYEKLEFFLARRRQGRIVVAFPEEGPLALGNQDISAFRFYVDAQPSKLEVHEPQPEDLIDPLDVDVDL